MRAGRIGYGPRYGRVGLRETGRGKHHECKKHTPDTLRKAAHKTPPAGGSMARVEFTTWQIPNKPQAPGGTRNHQLGRRFRVSYHRYKEIVRWSHCEFTVQFLPRQNFSIYNCRKVMKL